jgi:hypothetical protein
MNRRLNEMDKYIVEETRQYIMWTVGFVDQYREWHPESDHDSYESAAKRAEHLNNRKEAEAAEIAEADWTMEERRDLLRRMYWSS